LFKGDTVLLTDFGISANLKNRVTQKNIQEHPLKIFATLSYSPPEQSQADIAFKLTGPTNDVFSFGVVFYEMITKGKLPFGDIYDFNSDSEIVERNKILGNWKMETLKDYTDNDVWIDVIDKCLKPDPSLRFQSVNSIIHELESSITTNCKKSSTWTLIVNDGPDAGMEYNLTNLSRNLNKRILTFGRNDGSNQYVNDISILEDFSNFLSLRHGTLECVNRQDQVSWYIRDGQWYNKPGQRGWIRSKNGIKVNNVRIDELGLEIHDGDQIQIGNISLKVCCVKV
jgi:serine/threonine protein kinase